MAYIFVCPKPAQDSAMVALAKQMQLQDEKILFIDIIDEKHKKDTSDFLRTLGDLGLNPKDAEIISITNTSNSNNTSTRILGAISAEVQYGSQSPDQKIDGIIVYGDQTATTAPAIKALAEQHQSMPSLGRLFFKPMVVLDLRQNQMHHGSKHAKWSN